MAIARSVPSNRCRHGPGCPHDIGPAAGRMPGFGGGELVTAGVARMVSDAPIEGVPARPVFAGAVELGRDVVAGKRGVLHRLQADGRPHARCRSGATGEWPRVDEASAVDLALRNPNVLCRYAWCFRAVVEAMGLDPETGHVSRRIA